MPVAVATLSYADFMVVVNNLPRKFVVFYNENSGGNDFNCWAVATDMQALVELNVSTGIPSTFASDFPAAVQIVAASGIPTFLSVFTRSL